MPIRKIPKKYGSLSGQFVSQKLNQTLGFESSLERDLFTLLEFDPNVIYFEEQPIKLEYLDSEKKTRSYTPDVLIIYKNEIVSPFGKTHVLGEVKYRANFFSNWKELKPKFKAARSHCRKNDWKFSIFTEIEIRTPFLKNARFLLPFRSIEPNIYYCQKIIKLLNQLGITKVSHLLSQCSTLESEQLQILPYIWHLVVLGKIQMELNLPLTMKSELWLSGDKIDEH